ncbi:hypothetical protein [Ancylobacter oerskovii]|uniref:Uncharacterized protein n=1 Tax=Ancylobacter oerskovii TaxID=459519 RepID=A0ABW4YUZ8_9HYPH|nr:hypothetical protein [Ancylobacter oerskovii]MBS7544337.1 hypothetical protein [Ancylobacter oerskovii]
MEKRPDQPGADHATARLQYWPASHDVHAPDHWPDSYEFDTVEDAVAFAMTQSPSGRDLAWLRTPEGEILKAGQIRRLWELRQSH